MRSALLIGWEKWTYVCFYNSNVCTIGYPYIGWEEKVSRNWIYTKDETRVRINLFIKRRKLCCTSSISDWQISLIFLEKKFLFLSSQWFTLNWYWRFFFFCLLLGGLRLRVIILFVFRILSFNINDFFDFSITKRVSVSDQNLCIIQLETISFEKFVIKCPTSHFMDN